MKEASEMVERVANVEAASKHKAYVIRINRDWIEGNIIITQREIKNDV